MRLIDANKVKELINGLDSLPWEEELDDLVDSIPTAYDVEKVVEDVRIDCCAMGFDDSQIEIIVKDVRNGGKE